MPFVKEKRQWLPVVNVADEVRSRASSVTVPVGMGRKKVRVVRTAMALERSGVPPAAEAATPSDLAGRKLIIAL